MFGTCTLTTVDAVLLLEYIITVSTFINAGLNSNMLLDAWLSAALNRAFNAI